ncbi:RNA ligase family protein [Brevibacillus agri]|uniref:ATP-dependent DNA ligase n=1 Tax=Brevibacillus agri TaxID=51101 RepID=UPI002E1D8035|nr:RNA ligase family protein [Brevibacillus agri]MED1653478.1 RNA ligase family protein [Brevibacillus agri]MED1685281.1 RNA ligase family protein [Brevibacillus agri]MED1690710.1 RNA ligase family protein [Brevibacillus agri]MED1697483.1 RNA ligase family protein [Brevibacillus agri]
MKLTPIIPFEPTTTDDIADGPDWIAQVKWDGIRLLTYYDGNSVKLYNRKANERTLHYPEIAAISEYCRAQSVILDGEVVALGADGKPSFYEVMRRDGLRRMEKIAAVKRQVPIFYMIFDVLYADGEWVTACPLAERQRLLQKLISPTPTVQLVDNFTSGRELFQTIEQQGMEGVIIKDLTSTYAIAGKDARWQKKKNYRDLIAVVGGVTMRDQTVNSLLLGLYDAKGALWYIGHAGTGKLTHSDWRSLTETIQPLIQADMPFHNKPERINGTIWLKPQLTAKIQYAEWADGHSLRQPSIQGFVDSPARQCTFEA